MVLALPGSSGYPFESRRLVRTVRRAAVLGAYLSETSDVEAWMYGSRAHRLPSLRRSDAAQWVEDWAVLPKEPLFTQDAVPDNPLARFRREHGLDDDEEDLAAVVGEIARTVTRDGAPTLVLLYMWGAHSTKPVALADRLREEAGGNVFWLFLESSSWGSDVRRTLERLRTEATDIRNVRLYTGGWGDDLDEAFEYFFFRGVLKPFFRWRRHRRRALTK